MNTPIYRYNLDRTGVNPDNRVVDEEHQLSTRAIRCVAPTYGGFFAESVIVVDADTGIPLVYKQDYVFGELFEFPTGRYGKEIFGIIVIKKTGVSRVKITYQALGGDYSYSMDSVIAMLDNLNLGERPVEWGNIVGRPNLFNPASHFHDIGDVYGFEYVVHALERLRTAILLGDTASHDEIYRYIDSWGAELRAEIEAFSNLLDAHLIDFTNPHRVTKAQVSLGNVDNFGTATNAEAIAGTLNNKFMTPASSMAAIKKVAVEPMQAHINSQNNPHNVTKGQVGLSDVVNWGVGTNEQVLSGDKSLYASAEAVRNAIRVKAEEPLATHVADIANPHRTTKAQVGLSNVDNFSSATVVDVEKAAANKFVTAAVLYNYNRQTVQADLLEHIEDHENPHRTTKAHVGLGNVDNFATANSSTILNNKNDNEFTTALGVQNLIKTLSENGFEGRQAAMDKVAQKGSVHVAPDNSIHIASNGVWRQVWPPLWQP